jgi:hypothetical protein
MASSSKENSNEPNTPSNETMVDDDLMVTSGKPGKRNDFIEAQMTDVNFLLQNPIL